eukprot:scaffold133224_cov28-Prasinocladus_malaysianus.AAC.1
MPTMRSALLVSSSDGSNGMATGVPRLIPRLFPPGGRTGQMRILPSAPPDSTFKQHPSQTQIA